MATYKTPGVSIEEISKLPPSVAEVETAIPAFIGYTQFQGKSGNPLESGVEVVRISSLVEYVTYFGGTTPTDLEIVFDADGSTSVVKTDNKNTLYYHMQLYFANGGGPCYIVSVGTVTGAIDAPTLSWGLTVISRYDEPTLLVIPEAVNLDDPAEAYALYQDALTQAGKLKDRFVIMDCPGDDYQGIRDNIGTDLKYGAAYYPYLETSLSHINGEADVNVTIAGNTVTLASLKDTNSEKYAAAKQVLSGLGLTLNPSAAIAGVYAAVDSTRGVWKAPANVSLNYVSGLTVQIADTDQDLLNVDPIAGKSINAIRTITGKGHLVWGARTLAGNDNEWRYVSVRRFFNMVEESVGKATAAFVFEPNDANTWTKIQGMIENYLLTLWRAGALQGVKPEHAFYVSVGLGKTMTAQDILEGRLFVEIGMAAVRPAEFIILRFSHMMAQS